MPDMLCAASTEMRQLNLLFGEIDRRTKTPSGSNICLMTLGGGTFSKGQANRGEESLLATIGKEMAKQQQQKWGGQKTQKTEA